MRVNDGFLDDLDDNDDENNVYPWIPPHALNSKMRGLSGKGPVGNSVHEEQSVMTFVVGMPTPWLADKLMRTSEIVGETSVEGSRPLETIVQAGGTRHAMSFAMGKQSGSKRKPGSGLQVAALPLPICSGVHEGRSAWVESKTILVCNGLQKDLFAMKGVIPIISHVRSVEGRQMSLIISDGGAAKGDPGKLFRMPAVVGQTVAIGQSRGWRLYHSAIGRIHTLSQVEVAVDDVVTGEMVN
ncbi:hypothetical protein NE237_008806 [Protea cynaroides]|uniref:Uncharacterized protein n=1 Tax=Protea cynaroides TaxID=273540 RepID=A0A9Q0KWK5_9MAGN|nr:hypothetical protein NE237_008806 [Protea cynaroides]